MAGTNFRPGLQEIQSILDPLQAWNWNLLIPLIPGTADTRQISYKAISTTVPGSQVEQVPLETHGIKLNYAGRRVWSGTWNVTLVETRTASTRDSLLKWMDLARSWSGNSGSYKSVYGVTAELQLFDDLPQIIRSIRLYGLFPTQIDDASLEQSSSIVQYSCTFSYDWTEEFTGSE